MSKFETLNNYIIEALVKGASSGTIKYEVGSSSGDSKFKCSNSFASRVERVTSTILMLAESGGNTVEVKGSYYNVSEYQVPQFVQQIIKVHQVYLNGDAQFAADPLYSNEKHDLNDVMSPLEFNVFWTDYNSRQPEELKITTAPVQKVDITTISELEIVKTGADKAISIGGGVISSYAVELMDVRVELLDGYGKVVPLPSHAEVIEWILGHR